MLEKTKYPLYTKVFALLFVFVLTIVCCISAQVDAPADVAFAAEAYSVGDSQTITFIASPADACQDCTWQLTWDKDKTAAITYSIVKDKNPYEYLQLTTNESDCTITVLKYYKVVITYPVYLTLTATSTENTDLSVTCSIKLG